MLRSKSNIRTLTWLLLAWCLPWPVAVAQAQSEGDTERVEVLAGESIQVSEGGDTIEVRGNVEVRQGQTVFGADAVDVRRSAQTLRAEGSVTLRDPRYRLTASRLEMNLRDETATILDGEVFIEEGRISFSGSRLEKFPGQVYTVEDGLFTTCFCETGTSPWRIGARELRLSGEGDVEADDATFYVYDVPVLYLPYVSVPHQSQRTTGLLFPSVGWSDENGLLYRQPFFWALDKSNDATLNIVSESKTRLGVAGQYRTVLNRAAAGRLDVAYFSEKMRDTRVVANKRIADPEIPEDRWSAMLTHRQRGPWTTFSDVALYSDSLVTRELLEFSDLGSDARRLARTSRYSASRLGFYRHESGMTLQGLLDYQQDLVQPRRHTLHRMPHLSFTGARPLDNRLDFGWNVQLTNFVREKRADGLRVDIRPELTWPVTLGRHFRLATSVALRETLYRLDTVEGRFDAEQDGFSGKFPRNSSRELLEVRGRLATSLSRAYELNGDAWSRIRHVVEPAVEYLFIPHTDQSRLPIWDGIDRINRRNVLTASLTNRFWGTSGRAAAAERVAMRQLAVARVATNFDIDRSREGRDDLSDVDVDVRFSPARNLDVDAAAGLDPGPWNLQQAALGFSVSAAAPIETGVADRDFARPNRLSLRYLHIRENPLAPLAGDANLNPAADCPGDSRCEQRDPLNGLQADALLRLTDQILWLYDGSYDGEAGRMTRNRGSIKYLSECECWTFAVSVDRHTNPDRTLYSVKFNLLGLGS